MEGASATRDDDSPPPLVEAKALTKHFDGSVAVGGVDFAVARGEVFGFLGPNGEC